MSFPVVDTKEYSQRIQNLVRTLLKGFPIVDTTRIHKESINLVNRPLATGRVLMINKFTSFRKVRNLGVLWL